MNNYIIAINRACLELTKSPDPRLASVWIGSNISDRFSPITLRNLSKPIAAKPRLRPNPHCIRKNCVCAANFLRLKVWDVHRTSTEFVLERRSRFSAMRLRAQPTWHTIAFSRDSLGLRARSRRMNKRCRMCHTLMFSMASSLTRWLRIKKLDIRILRDDRQHRCREYYPERIAANIRLHRYQRPTVSRRPIITILQTIY